MNRTSTEGNSSPTNQETPRLTTTQLLRQVAVIVVVLVVWSGILVGYLALTKPSEAAPATATPSSDSAPVSFSADVLPIFEARCQRCHGSGEAQAGLRLTSHADVLTGSNNGPVVIPGNADGSYLVDLIVSGQMPLGGAKLPESEIQTIINWIDAGAPDN